MTALPKGSAVRDAEETQPDTPSKESIDLTRDTPAPLLGGHSVSDPPDPISNSAVKPDCADGTNA